MARKISLWLLAALIGFCITLSNYALAASFSISVTDSSGATDSTVTIPIKVTDAQNIGSLELSLTYDSTILAAKEVSAGDMLPGALIDYNADNAGTIRVAVAGGQVQGTGNLLKVQFTVKGRQGQESLIGLKDVRAWDASVEAPEMLLKGTQEGHFTVGGASQMTIYLIIGAIVSVILIILLFTRLRKKE
ncbi:MAG: hypothetical protein IT342_27590 [Candidatus Melainabacteria bacterium]|nr:hypothetical protein [Candidatus Melainabacteria bacterium]